MVSARTFGMTANRYIDRHIDRENPRTHRRAIPAGQLSLAFVWIAMLSSASIFLVSALFLPPICLYLSPLPLFAMAIYPYLKRFTALNHIILGCILGAAPVGGWLVVKGSFEILPFLMAAGVIFWVAGFDILYALQDYHFDLKTKLFSIPVRLGRRRAIWISRLFHFLTLAAFGAVIALSRGGFWAWTGFFLSGALIFREHRLIVEDRLGKLETAFFTSNAWVSVVFFTGILLDLIAG
jgi:4-hydroxybenzoate polyprenyltransferase